MRTPKQSQLVPNAPAGPPFTPQFPRKSCKSPGNALHWSLQATLAPAALPQLDTLRPMKTVCPSCQCPPTMPSAPPRSLPSLVASVHCPHFTKNRFLRTSQIVSDRLGSSRIVRAHRRSPPAIPAEWPQCSPASARQTGKKARHFAPKYARKRPCEKKLFRDISESSTFPTAGQQESASTACLRSALTLVRQLLGAQTAARAVAVNCVHHKNQMNCSSDKCQRTLETKNPKLKTQNQQDIPPPERKKYRDIWGHLGTFGDLCPLSRRNHRTSVSVGKGPGRQPFQICPHAVHGTNSLTN